MIMDDETQVPAPESTEPAPAPEPIPEPVPVQEPSPPVDLAILEAQNRIGAHFSEWFPENATAEKPIKYLSAEWHYVRDAFESLKAKFS